MREIERECERKRKMGGGGGRGERQKIGRAREKGWKEGEIDR